MNKDKNKMIEEMARFPIYAGCSIISEDEVGIKKSELARLKNLEINYEQVYEDYRKLEQERKSYRKIAEDEQVVNAEQFFETLNAAQECGKRIGYAQGREETAREILKWMDEPFTDKEIRKLITEKYGIE